jgi:malonyl-CoA/methylmalonyl-CoA synthetase
LLAAHISHDAAVFECDDGRTFSGRAFWSLAGRFAQYLKEQGALPGDRVALHTDKSVEALALFWACVRGGFIYLPLNPAYTLAEVSYFVADAEPHALFCRPLEYDVYRSHFSGTRAPRVFALPDTGFGQVMANVDRAASAFDNVSATWDDTAAILYTSGTTGRSKGAMLTHRNLASNALALVEAWQFSDRDVLIHALPVFHTHGLFTATNTALLSGAKMLFRRKFDVDDVVALIPHATALMGVPTFYTRLLQHDGVTTAACRAMRIFISGSAPLLAETHRAFEMRTGHSILERYGMTETSMNSSNPYDGDRRAGTVGMPLTGIDIRIADLTDERVLGRNETGMIQVKGPNVFKGYWRNPEKTAEDMTGDGYFRTGDVGQFDSDGYLSITGRAKDLIITGGFNVYPKEVEDVIDALAGVSESAVIGLPHDDFGEAVTAVVVAKLGEGVSEQQILYAAAEALAKFKVPKKVVIVEALPRNAMGKVQKAELRKTYGQLYRPV